MRMKEIMMINTEEEISDIRTLICELRAKLLPQVIHSDSSIPMWSISNKEIAYAT